MYHAVLAFFLTKNPEKMTIKLVKLPRVISKHSAVTFVKGNGILCSGCVRVPFFFFTCTYGEQIRVFSYCRITYDATVGGFV